MDKKIKKLLEQNNIKFKAIEHRKVYTAFNEAETQHVDPKTVVKTVLAKLSKTSTHLLDSGEVVHIDYVLVSIPSKKRVDFKKISKAINDHQTKSHKKLSKENYKIKKPSAINAKMATEKDITKKLKTKIGLLSAFGQLYNLPVLVDKKLLKNKKLIVAAGSYTESIELSPRDFLRITPHLEGNFTE